MLAHLRLLRIRRKLQLSLQPKPEYRSRRLAQMKGERRERYLRTIRELNLTEGN